MIQKLTLVLLTTIYSFTSYFSQTNIWTGATDTDWHKSCNWSLNSIPVCTDSVVIPTVTNYPVVTGIAHSLSVDITSTSPDALTISSGNLDVSYGGGSCSGTITDNSAGGCGSSCSQVISAGFLHSLALCNTGTCQSWGTDASGQLGNDAALTAKPTPVAVASLTGIVAVAAGSNHSLALKNDGTVWAWGNDASGQLGNDAALANKSTPVAVASLTGITAISAGRQHSLALKNDSTVWSWGYNGQGQLGDGSTTDKPTPVAVSSLTGIVAIAAGHIHSLALKKDGTVWSWGNNFFGQMGNGTTSCSTCANSTPVQVTGLTGVIAISGGFGHSLALKSDGTVWSWGRDADGELGNDVALANKTTAVNVASLTGIIAIAAGGGGNGLGAGSHSIALKNDGTVWSWGDDTYGQLGDDAALVQKATPVAVATISGITSISAGADHCLAVKSDGTVWSWGMDVSGGSGGQLGNDAALVNKATPVTVSNPCTVSCSP